jgi:GT2 family glycosyltransferase
VAGERAQRGRALGVTDVGCVVLSMGTRPTDLARALDSVLRQTHISVDCLVVGNGWQPSGLPGSARALALDTNVGIPEGRNIGAREVAGDVLLFFDDDAEFPDPETLRRVVEKFDADPTLAVVQPRVEDPHGLPTARRHVPRIRVGDPMQGGDVAWFWEGTCFIRRSAFEQISGWPGHFFYGHEGIEVAWRIIDAGYRISYATDVVVRHTSAAPSRHAVYRFNNARNRVWVAKRNLPHGALELYIMVWFVATFLRIRQRSEALIAMRGFIAGFREPAGVRRPISWRTAWRLTRLGRPPIV